MELQVMKLMTYSFIAILGALFIYITALAVFLYNRIERVKHNK